MTRTHVVIIGDGVQLLVDTAIRINTADQRILLATGRELTYEYLIYAAGSTGTVPTSVPGAIEFGYSVAEFEQAQRLRAALEELHPDAPVAVVGGGLTGIETAAELAGQGRAVTLVCGGLLGPSRPSAHRAAGRWPRPCERWVSRYVRRAWSPRFDPTR